MHVYFELWGHTDMSSVLLPLKIMSVFVYSCVAVTGCMWGSVSVGPVVFILLYKNGICYTSQTGISGLGVLSET